MRRRHVTGIAVTLLAISMLGACSRGRVSTRPLRAGWQPPWANQGQIVEVLMHTDVLSKRGVTAEFRPFTYGGPMTEAALAGDIDLLFVGNQPAITLISRDDRWRIAARLTNYRSAIVVPTDSPIRTLADLKGKTLATAFGSTTHRDAVRHLLEAGFDVSNDLTLINLDQAEHAAVIARGGAQRWGDIDAIATYDPTVAVALESQRARLVADWPSPAVVVANVSLFDRRSEELKGFLAAYAEAYTLYAAEPTKFDQLYQLDSRLPLKPETYRAMARYEANLSQKNLSAVNIRLDDRALDSLVQDANIALKLGIVKNGVDIRRFVDQRALP